MDKSNYIAILTQNDLYDLYDLYVKKSICTTYT